MTEHELAAMEAAIKYERDAEESPYFANGMRRGWEAARAYKPPKVCGELRPGSVHVCTLDDGHEGDHRREQAFREYIGWPRT